MCHFVPFGSRAWKLLTADLPEARPTANSATIIGKQIEGWNVEQISLVGGTSCLTGIEKAIETRLGVPVYKPKNPMFVTPLGIALNCKQEERY